MLLSIRVFFPVLWRVVGGEASRQRSLTIALHVLAVQPKHTDLCPTHSKPCRGISGTSWLDHGWQSWDLREAENVYKEFCRDSPGGPGAKNLPSNVGYVGLIPGWGTKLPRAEEQLSSCTQQQLSRQTTAREPAGRREDPLAAAKTRCSRIHK